MLLSVPTGVVHGDIDGPGPRHRICRLQVGVVRFLLKDVDRSLGICSEGRRKAVEGAADGDERSPREIDDPQIEQIHSDGGHVRRSVHRRLLDYGRLHSGDRAQHRDLARRHHHLSLFRNLRQRASGSRRDKHAALLELLQIHVNSTKSLLQGFFLERNTLCTVIRSVN